MKLKFYETITNLIEIDEDTFNEYLDSCKEVETFPTRDDFIDWITSNFYMSDFIVVNEDETDYSLTNKQFNKYLEEFDND